MKCRIHIRDTAFIIRKSPQGATKETLISPDLAICEDCKREIKTKTDRRYEYAFTNCTNCGPRFSKSCKTFRMTVSIRQ